MTDTALSDTEPVAYARFSRRMYALIIDALILMTVFIAVIVLITIGLPSGAEGIAIGAVVAAVLLYDPIMVSARGGTVGHYRMNLRVVKEDGGRLGFLRALLRSWLKALTGLFAFFFMPITRRHQALHDLVSGSVVTIHDLDLAETRHYRFEKPDLEAEVKVGRARRVSIIVAYSVVCFIGLSILSASLVSSECVTSNVCSSSEDAVFSAIGLVMIISIGFVMVWGWMGRLPGARSRTKPYTRGTEASENDSI